MRMPWLHSIVHGWNLKRLLLITPPSGAAGVGPVYLQDPNLIITGPADASAPKGIMIATDKMLTEKLDIFSSLILGLGGIH